MFDANDFEIEYKNNVSFIPNLKSSPKFQNTSFIKNRDNFHKKYKIFSHNFFLANTLEVGGLSNYWGLQIDKNILGDLNHLNYKTKKKILK